MKQAFSRRFQSVTAAMAALSLLSVVPQSSLAHDHDAMSDHTLPGKSALVTKVRAATRPYLDINVALTEGFMQGTPCVSGPNEGAMGLHFMHPARVGDGELIVDQPEMLMYEPQSDGSYRLVGVEYLVLAPDWEKQHPEGGVPVVGGMLTHYVGSPNRYGLPPFYELHVWAWKNNPKGSFADWNTRVSCEKLQSA
jgi:hypothetical protein